MSGNQLQQVHRPHPHHCDPNGADEPVCRCARSRAPSLEVLVSIVRDVSTHLGFGSNALAITEEEALLFGRSCTLGSYCTHSSLASTGKIFQGGRVDRLPPLGSRVWFALFSRLLCSEHCCQGRYIFLSADLGGVEHHGTNMNRQMLSDTGHALAMDF